jgi:hypothetical protein
VQKFSVFTKQIILLWILPPNVQDREFTISVLPQWKIAARPLVSHPRITYSKTLAGHISAPYFIHQKLEIRNLTFVAHKLKIDSTCLHSTCPHPTCLHSTFLHSTFPILHVSILQYSTCLHPTCLRSTWLHGYMSLFPLEITWNIDPYVIFFWAT